MRDTIYLHFASEILMVKKKENKAKSDLLQRSCLVRFRRWQDCGYCDAREYNYQWSGHS